MLVSELETDALQRPVVDTCGDAVLLRRNGATWTYPAFYSMGSPSLGLQAGISSAQIVMLLMTDRAVAAVRRAFEHGFEEIERLKKDKDLDPIRSRSDFEKLVHGRERKMPSKAHVPATA